MEYDILDFRMAICEISEKIMSYKLLELDFIENKEDDRAEIIRACITQLEDQLEKLLNQR